MNGLAVNSETLKDQARGVLESMKQTNMEAVRTLGGYIKALLDKNVVALGEGEAFVLRDESGEIVSTKSFVRLSEANGGLVQPVTGGPWCVSALGYTMLAAGTGAVVMNAPTVIVDGKVQQNPYVRRDARGRIVEIYCRAMAFRYNESGQPQVSDRTVIFDVNTYMMADMVGKAKYTKQAFKLLPANAAAPSDEWASYPLDDYVNLWMLLTHDEALKFMGQIANRQKKAMEFAQTFAQRNAMKHLLGIALTPNKGKDSVWTVPVTCWRPRNGGMVRLDTTLYTKAAATIDALSAGTTPSLPEAQHPDVQLVSRGEDLIMGADLDEELDPNEAPDAYEAQQNGPTGAHDTGMEHDGAILTTAVRDEQQPTGHMMTQQDAPHEAEPTQEHGPGMKKLLASKANFPEEYKAALKALKITEIQVCEDNAPKIMREINRQLDA